MALLRKIVFYIFLLIYLIVCPMIILYAFGFMLKPGAERGIMKSGLIYLSTVPPQGTVYLGGSQFTEKTPAIIRDLLPENYDVRISLKGYRSWQQVVPVEAEKASVLEKILLLPNQLKTEVLTQETFEDMIPVVDTDFMVLKNSERLDDLFIYNWHEERKYSLAEKGFYFQAAKVDSFFTIKESPYLFVSARSKESNHFLWIDLKDEKISEWKDLVSVISGEPLVVKWDAQSEDRLFAVKDRNLTQMEVDAEALKPNIVMGVRGFDVFRRDLYILKDDYTFVRTNFSGKVEETLFDDNVAGRSLFGQEGFWDVHVLNPDLILFLGEHGEVVTNRLPYELIKGGVEGILPDRKAGKVLVWTRDKLGVIMFPKKKSLRGKFEEGPTIKWLFEDAERMEQVFWVYEGSHVLFRDGSRVLLLNLEVYGQPAAYGLVTVKQGSSVYYAEESGKLYYLDAETGHLTSAVILPKREIIAFPFPERKEKAKEKDAQTV